MSQLYYNYFLMCYTKEPPTVTDAQLATALQRGMLTQMEYDRIIASKPQPEPEPIVEEAPAEPVTEEPLTTTEPPTSTSAPTTPQ